MSVINDQTQSTVRMKVRRDGAILLDNAQTLPPLAVSIPARLGHWARETPAATYLSEGEGENERRLSFAQAEAMRRQLAGHLLAAGVSRENPLMVMARNGINHAVIMLAATSVGIPVALVSPTYASADTGGHKLRRILEKVTPGLVLVDNVAATQTALAAANCVASVQPIHDLGWLDQIPAAQDAAIDAAEAGVGPDTVAKLLFTSGSTGSPKPVINTQRMMVSNMQGLALVWPFLAERPPVLVDWLPWNHTFGGNCCFHIALWFGGHLHIDPGRPAALLISQTIHAIRTHGPSVYFNVPIGYELLLPTLESDKAFAAEFLGRLDFLFSAGAPMPAGIRSRLDAASMAAIGRVPPIAGGWGSTETAPFSAVLNFPTNHAGNLGIPLPGTTIKMVPDNGRYELRVRGPNVTPGYWRDPETTEKAFDEEEFYKIGDAGKLADHGDASAGILFDGRVAENFKLSSGTFVNVGGIRVAAVTAGERLISDVVVAGEGRHELGLLLFLNEGACQQYLTQNGCEACEGGGLHDHPALTVRLAELLRSYNDSVSGSSTRVARFAIARGAPDPAHDEITEKGHINQRRVLQRRSAIIEQLFEDGIVL